MSVDFTCHSIVCHTFSSARRYNRFRARLKGTESMLENPFRLPFIAASSTYGIRISFALLCSLHPSLYPLPSLYPPSSISLPSLSLTSSLPPLCLYPFPLLSLPPYHLAAWRSVSFSFDRISLDRMTVYRTTMIPYIASHRIAYLPDLSTILNDTSPHCPALYSKCNSIFLALFHSLLISKSYCSSKQDKSNQILLLTSIYSLHQSIHQSIHQ